MSGSEKMSFELSENDVQNLMEFLKVVSDLKESGMLEILKSLSEKSNEVFLAVASDPSLMRGVALLAALLQGLSKADAEKLAEAQNSLASTTKCLVEAVGSVDTKKVKKIGLTGLLGALSDPDVQYGLGLFIAIIKELGKGCRKQQQI
ncbi:MAG: DUF1641 domain-containing protein [Nitrososphaeria archaeon]